MHRVEAHLQTFDLDQTATLAEIKQAYRDLVMVWHPDRFAHNVRLRHKAEEKLKQFNQAYDCLKEWCIDPRPSAPQPQPSTQAKTERAKTERSPHADRQHTQTSRETAQATAHPPPPHVKTSGLCITFAHAEYILGHYCFVPLKDIDSTHHDYQSGPFVLRVCDKPVTLTLSVPCHSLQHFDRILLSIPCKSTGHFSEAEAKTLLKLLHFQPSH